MRFEIRILPAADADLDEAADHIAQDSTEHALRLYDAADVTFRLIREHPERGPVYELDHPRLRGMRRCAIAGFRNHLVFYRIEGDVVQFVRILHGARDIPAELIDRVGDDAE